MRSRAVLSTLVTIWLIIGVLAAFQRGYLLTPEQNCATIGSTITTVLAGPLNYVGVNPEIECPPVPQPSE